jgi:hypothetical protein
MVCLRSIEKPQGSKGGIIMLEQYGIVPYRAQAKQSLTKKEGEPRERSQWYGMTFLRFLEPLVRELDVTVDKRPLRTLVQTVEAIVSFRDRNHGLLLSELGDSMDGLDQGGGTKRLSTLIHHKGWKAQQIDAFLLRRADEQIAQWQAKGEDGLLIWDGTVLEKPESLKGEGLCAVRSSKAARLTHVKKGYYHPPGAPIFVPGLHGIGLLLAGRATRQGPPLLAALRWWTSRGPLASHEKDENCKLLRMASQRWGHSIIHVFDRGYCGKPWLGALRGFQVRFIERWKTNYHLLDAAGSKQAAWKIARGKPGLAPRTIYDAVHHRNVEGRVLFFPVTHPDFPDWPAFARRRAAQRGATLVFADQRGRHHGRRGLESRAGLRSSVAHRDDVPQPEKRNGHPEFARLRLGGASQTARHADTGLRLSHGCDAPGAQNGTRLAP